MKTKYTEIIENVAVTDEMEERILKNIQTASLKTQKIVHFSRIKKIAAFAACFILLIAGTMSLPHLLQNNIEPPVQVVPDIQTFESKAELEHAVGFACDEIESLHFEVTATVYTSYWDTIAEITYQGEENTLYFRKSQGTEDNSGDYNKYPYEDTLVIGKLSIQMKGKSETNINLICFTKNDFSYSIFSETGFGREQMIETIENIFEE